jgi:tmRNA-binding protein
MKKILVFLMVGLMMASTVAMAQGKKKADRRQGAKLRSR